MTSAVAGNLSYSLVFLSMYNLSTKYFYNHCRLTKQRDFRLKNALIYLSSDAAASVFRIFFDVRKQLIQMCNQNVLIADCGKRALRSFLPTLIRDLLFRTFTLSGFYGLTEINQETQLKYPIQHINVTIREMRQNGHNPSQAELADLFYDHHNYKINQKLHIRFMLLWLTVFVATLLTNPLDLVITRMNTQMAQPGMPGSSVKYGFNFIASLRAVAKEEGFQKLLVGGLMPRFLFNLLNGVLFLYFYDRVIFVLAEKEGGTSRKH